MRYLLIVALCFTPIFSAHSKNSLRDQAKFYREKGYELQSLGEWEKALMYYQKAMQLYPYDAELNNDLGVVYEGMGRTEDAEKMYLRAIELDPNYLPTYTNLAFFYEKKKDLEKASDYWKKRYELGYEGDFWREVAKEHLLKLGTYPQFERERLEKQAAKLSREVVTNLEKERNDKIKEATLHFDIGCSLFLKGDYQRAMEELLIAKSFNAPDEDLQKKVNDLYQQAERIQTREQAIDYTREALSLIKQDDFLSASEKLKKALSAVCRISQKK